MDGRPFELLKFRTMRGLRPGETIPESDAARITRWVRCCGRPASTSCRRLSTCCAATWPSSGRARCRVRYVDRYTPTQARRLEVRPGITGWAQVNGRNDLAWDEKFALDVWYVDHRSLAPRRRHPRRDRGQVVRRGGDRPRRPRHHARVRRRPAPLPTGSRPRDLQRAALVGGPAGRAARVLPGGARGARARRAGARRRPLAAVVGVPRADAGVLVPALRRATSSFPRCSSVCRSTTIRPGRADHRPRAPGATPRHRDEFAALGMTVAVSRPGVGRDRCRQGAHPRMAHGARVPDRPPGRSGRRRRRAAGWAFPLVVKPRCGQRVDRRGGGPTTAASSSVAARAGDFVVQDGGARATSTRSTCSSTATGRWSCAVPRRRLEVRGGRGEQGGDRPARRRWRGWPVEICRGPPGRLRRAQRAGVPATRRRARSAVIEVNARFGGGYPAGRRGRRRLPAWLVEEASGCPSTAAARRMAGRRRHAALRRRGVRRPRRAGL